MCAPWRRRARATKLVGVSATSAPISRSPSRCCSTRRIPMSSPPGLAISASPARPTSAPRRRKEPRIRRVRSAPTSTAETLGGHPQVAEHRHHGADVLDLRDVTQLEGLVGEQRRRHHRQRGVLAPRDRHLSAERPPAHDAKHVHRPPTVQESEASERPPAAGQIAANRATRHSPPRIGQNRGEDPFPEDTMATVTATPQSKLEEILGDEAQELLEHRCQTVSKERLHLPGPDFIDRVWSASDRNVRVLRSLQTLFEHGRLGGTGYLSILPVDQGIEHSAGASFAPNPDYFDGEKIVELAVEGGCNAVASTFGVLGSVARRWAHRIPFIVKLNHNELLTYPNKFDQIMFGTVKEAWNLGAVAVGATIYFGSEEADRQIQEVSVAFAAAHELGMATILWCYLRNSAFKKDGVDYSLAADLTGQANHLGVTIEADIIKQKMPENNNGYGAMNQNGGSYGKTSPLVYSELSSDHPI